MDLKKLEHGSLDLVEYVIMVCGAYVVTLLNEARICGACNSDEQTPKRYTERCWDIGLCVQIVLDYCGFIG